MTVAFGTLAALALGAAACGSDSGISQGWSCGNGSLDADETDVDCGGHTCKKCEGLYRCKTGSDCLSDYCKSNGWCSSLPRCSDGQKDEGERDVDCGGVCSARCRLGQACITRFDCESGVCGTFFTCVAPRCDDYYRDGNESDIDCGGDSCAGCEAGSACNVGSDCGSKVCEVGRCVVASCKDAVQNGAESDVDCGGSGCAKCGVDLRCAASSDCVSGRCLGGRCNGCNDAAKDGTESDVDCGGSCAKCGMTRKCAAGTDCTSGVCVAGVCAARTVAFDKPTFLPAADSPHALLAAELDGDSRTDLVTIEESGTTLAAFLTKTASAKGRLVLAGSRAAVAGDLDGDGLLDVAIAAPSSNLIQRLRGRGDGTFDSLTTLAVSAPGALAVADVNGDSRLDLLAGGATGIVVWLGGAAGEPTPIPSALGVAPDAFATLDLDGVGGLDLAFVESTAQRVGLAKGKGDGSFLVGAPVSLGSTLGGLATADFDGDGRMDIAVSYVDASGAGVTVLFGETGGAFTPVSFPVAWKSGTGAIAVADFDLDGLPDVVVTDSSTPTLTVLFATRIRTLDRSLKIVLPAPAASVVALEVDVDGRLDVAASIPNTNQLAGALNKSN